MKTTLKKFFALTAIAAAFAGCSSSDDNNNSGFLVDPNNLQGTITSGNVTFNANTVYKLTGALVVADGATLTIPAGTEIEGVGGTSAYIAVAQGGKIFINGTASDPVVMTSGLATKNAGDWGGLVICGKAPINRVSGGTSTASAEVSELTYGGTNPADSSGEIHYLRVEYTGAAFNSEKEFNGVSFFGVGSGTVVDHVEAYHGSDDGFEFFGGTVNISNMISIGNEDDQFDWTEGWSGTATNLYGKLDFGKGNRGIEADNYEFGFSNTPVSSPTITNLTLIGPGSGADANVYTENDGLKLRRGTHGIFVNVVIANWKTGFNVENDETIAAIPSALLANPVFVAGDVATLVKGKDNNGTTVDASGVAVEGAATGAGNGVNQPTWAAGWSVGF